MESTKNRFYKIAFILAGITVFYNVFEGVVSIFFGLEDETLSLFGFGADSFIEVISGIGIWHMLVKIRNSGNETRDEFEKSALKVTGFSFYILCAVLSITSIYNLAVGHKPETTLWGIIVSVVSIITMSLLVKFKLRIGRALNSNALIADANCTKTCLYLSFALLASSISYELFKIGGIDSIGALIIAYFSFKEGRESFEKARSGKNCGCEENSCGG